MKFNVSGLDRVLRVIVGVVLIALAATGTVGWWGWLGIIPLLTGLMRFCPIYPLLSVASRTIIRTLMKQAWLRIVPALHSLHWGFALQSRLG